MPANCSYLAMSLLLLASPFASCSAQSQATPHWVAVVRPYLESHRGDIPLPFLLGWISVESNGRIAEVTALDERGYFQIHPDESSDLHFDHQRLSTDSDYSLQCGIDLVNHYAHAAETLGFGRGSDVFWHVVKLGHAMGFSSVKKIAGDMAQDNVKPQTWQIISSYCASNRARILHQTKHDPVKWTANVDEVFRRGEKLAQP